MERIVTARIEITRVIDEQGRYGIGLNVNGVDGAELNEIEALGLMERAKAEMLYRIRKDAQ